MSHNGMVTMRAIPRSMALCGLLAVGGLGLAMAPSSARAQGFGPGLYGGLPGGYSNGVPNGGGACGVRNYGGGANGIGVGGGYGGGMPYGGAGGYGGGYYGGVSQGYGGGAIGLPGYNPNLPYSPARQQGWREGQVFWETGLVSNHPLSPAEAQGFVAGERRAANGGYRLW